MLRSFKPPPAPRAPAFTSQRRVVFPPRATDAMWAGVSAIVAALRPTLGPRARTVLAERNTGRHLSPDVLHDGGVIARRVITLPDPDADVGAMLLRHALWRVHERAGDAVATTAVLFQAIACHARPYLAAGGNAMRLRDGILFAAEVVVGELARRAEPLDAEMDGETLRAWIRAHCDDAALTDAMAAILSSTAPDTTIRVENGRSTRIEHEFIRGALWPTGWHGSPFSPQEHSDRLMLRLPGAHVLVSDLDLSDMAYMEPLVLALAKLRPARLLIVCRKVSPQLLSLFVQARQKGIGDAIFVKPPTVSGADRVALLTDMAVLTGATFIPYVEVRDGTTPTVNLADWLPHCLGRAGVAWASEHFTGIEDGCGDRAAQVAHLGKLHAALEAEDDPERIRFYDERMATFGSGVTRLKVGAHTEAEQKQRKAMAERVVRLVTQARRYGVVPGAGKALMQCERALSRSATALKDDDARFGAQCVARALSAPARVIAENAGLDGEAVVQRNRTSRSGRGVDVLTGNVVDLRRAGILDSAFALQLAIMTAASAAATLLTTDVIVHRRQRDVALHP